MLEQRGIASAREVSEAVARCQLHGGHLTTSLLQFMHVDEARVSAALSECYGIPAAMVGPLPRPDAAAFAALPRELAERYCCFPLEAGPGWLALAVAQPFEPSFKEELSFALGVNIEERAALEVRIREALARHYGVPLSARTQRGIARLEGALDGSSETPVAMWSDTLAALPQPPSDELAPPTSPRSSVSPAARGPAAARPSTAPARGSGSARPPAAGSAPRASQRAPGAASAPPASNRARSSGRTPVATLAAARQALARASTRQEVLEAFTGLAQSCFEYGALFAVQSNLAEGLTAWGPGADRDAVQAIGVPLDLPSSLSEAAESCRARFTRLAADGLDRKLSADLERPIGARALILPVSLRGRSVLLLYADNGGREVSEEEARDVVALAPDVATALARIIVQRKRESGRAGTGSRSDAPLGASVPPTYLEGASPRATTPGIAPSPEVVSRRGSVRPPSADMSELPAFESKPRDRSRMNGRHAPPSNTSSAAEDATDGPIPSQRVVVVGGDDAARGAPASAPVAAAPTGRAGAGRIEASDTAPRDALERAATSSEDPVFLLGRPAGAALPPDATREPASAPNAAESASVVRAPDAGAVLEPEAAAPPVPASDAPPRAAAGRAGATHERAPVPVTRHVAKPPTTITTPARTIGSRPRLPSVIVDPEVTDTAAALRWAVTRPPLTRERAPQEESAARGSGLVTTPVGPRGSDRAVVPPLAEAPRPSPAGSDAGTSAARRAARTEPPKAAPAPFPLASDMQQSAARRAGLSSAPPSAAASATVGGAAGRRAIAPPPATLGDGVELDAEASQQPARPAPERTPVTSGVGPEQPTLRAVAPSKPRAGAARERPVAVPEAARGRSSTPPKPAPGAPATGASRAAPSAKPPAQVSVAKASTPGAAPRTTTGAGGAASASPAARVSSEGAAAQRSGSAPPAATLERRASVANDGPAATTAPAPRPVPAAAAPAPAAPVAPAPEASSASELTASAAPIATEPRPTGAEPQPELVTTTAAPTAAPTADVVSERAASSAGPGTTSAAPDAPGHAASESAPPAASLEPSPASTSGAPEAPRPALPPPPPDEDLEQLVELMCQGNSKALQQLSSLGAAPVSQLMARFPGPVISERAGPSTRASECGPLLQALAAIGSPAMPDIARSSENQDARVRRWATLLLGEMPSPESCRAVVQRLADEVPRVHQAALDAARQLLASPAANSFRKTLFEVAEAEDAPLTLRLRTLEHVAKLKDSASVPRLIQLLTLDTEPVVHKALWALTVVTRQDFGRDVQAWWHFWHSHQAQHRCQWLIEALDHKDARLRKAAAEELHAEAQDDFGYAEDLPDSERAKARDRYREWWDTIGARRYGRIP